MHPTTLRSFLLGLVVGTVVTLCAHRWPALEMDVLRNVNETSFTIVHHTNATRAVNLTSAYILSTTIMPASTTDVQTMLALKSATMSAKNIATTTSTARIATTTPKPADLWVGVRFGGRLGNQLFQVASCVGIARARGARCCLFDLEGSMLEAAVELLEPLPKCPYAFPSQLEGSGNQCFVPELMVPTGASVTVGEYLQSWRYFAPGPLPFRLRERDWVAARKFNLGIHVRRTDMGESFRPWYFEAALAHVRALTNETLVAVVVTDDPAWVRAQPFFDNMTLSEGRTPGQDMALLAACRHLILTVGTFGWWAAYLRTAKGTVVHYVPKWESNNGAAHRALDFYPPGWIAVRYASDDPCTKCTPDELANAA
jgi:hypothetical protein